MTGDQQDDLLFFVVHEAYQVAHPAAAPWNYHAVLVPLKRFLESRAWI